MVYLQRCSWKLCLINYKLYICIVPLTSIYFHLRFLWESDLRISCLQETTENRTGKNTCLIILRFPAGTVVNRTLPSLQRVKLKKLRLQSLYLEIHGKVSLNVHLFPWFPGKYLLISPFSYFALLSALWLYFSNFWKS